MKILKARNWGRQKVLNKRAKIVLKKARYKIVLRLDEETLT